MIFKRPNVSLFPLGCDTLCDTAHLIPPLPLAPGQTYGSQYTIKWYVDGNLYYTGPVLTLAGLSLNVQHLIHIVVTDNMTGCTSISGDYALFIKHCGDCDCSGSHWGEISLSDPIIAGNPLILSCNHNYILNCNKPYTINASYVCKDTSCPGKVTYSLQPPTGPPLTGNVPLTFTPNQNGVYVLTLYGWCGNKKCDSCTIDLTVKCDSCDCKGSHWGPIKVTKGDIAGGENKVNANVVIGNPLVVQCGKIYTLNCKQPYTVNASFICKDSTCPGKVTYSLQPPVGLPLTGNLPLVFMPNQNGVYILTLYGWCGNKICDSCIIKFTVKCDPCNCDGSHWGNITLSAGIPNDNPNGAVIGIPNNNISLSCGKTYNLECNKPYSFNANYICKDSACNGTVTYKLQPPIGPAITGNVAGSFTPTQSGIYVLTLYGWCGNKICDSCVIKFNVKCDPCNCTGSHWGEIVLTQDNGGGNPNGIANIPAQQFLNCGGTYKLDCNKSVTINAAFNCADPNCPGKVTYSLQPPTGSPLTGNMPLTFTPNQNGTYVLTLYGWCGGKICDTCIIKFDVQCEVACDCKGSHWGEMTISDGVKKGQLSCKKEYIWKCNVPFTVNAAFICAQPACPGSVTYKLTPPSGFPVSGNVAFTYTPIQSGVYTVMLYGWCGNKICDSCIFMLKVDCPVDTNCCKHSIKIDAGTVNYTPTTNATIAGQTFTITGLAAVPLTEVRAEVISYDLSSNYNNECLGCKTFPFTWASINSAGNIGVVPAMITLFGGATTPLFNPTGTAVYQNPREVIWNNGNTFTITGPVGINFILPPQPVLDCCELKGKICVKFFFRDVKCMECEAVVCFDVVLKKK